MSLIYGAGAILQNSVKSILQPLNKESKVNLIKKGEDIIAYTDHTDIFINKEHSLITKRKHYDQVYTIWGLGAHELAHILYTSSSQYLIDNPTIISNSLKYQKLLNKFLDKIKGEFKYSNDQISELFLNFYLKELLSFLNIVEDGYIEPTFIKEHHNEYIAKGLMNFRHFFEKESIEIINEYIDKYDTGQLSDYQLMCNFLLTYGRYGKYKQFDQSKKLIQDFLGYRKAYLYVLTRDDSLIRQKESCLFFENLFNDYKDELFDSLYQLLKQQEIMDLLRDFMEQIQEAMQDGSNDGSENESKQPSQDMNRGDIKKVPFKSRSGEENDDKNDSQESNEQSGSSSQSEDNSDENSSDGSTSSGEKDDSEKEDSDDNDSGNSTSNSKDNEDETSEKNDGESSTNDSNKDSDDESSEESDKDQSGENKDSQKFDNNSDEEDGSDKTFEEERAMEHNTGNPMPEKEIKTIGTAVESLAGDKDCVDLSNLDLKNRKKTKRHNDLALQSIDETMFEIKQCPIDKIVVDSLINRNEGFFNDMKTLQRKLNRITVNQKPIEKRGNFTGQRLDKRSFSRKDKRYYASKVIPKSKSDLAISILIDTSGSTSGLCNNVVINTFRLALVPLSMICESLNISLKISSFNSSIYTTIREVKKRNEKADINKLLSIPSAGGNHDGIAMRVMLEELKKCSESKKMFFMFSDGDPTYNDVSKDIMIKHMQNVMFDYPGIETVAFGVGKDAHKIAQIYNQQKFVDCSNPSLLSENILKILKKKTGKL